MPVRLYPDDREDEPVQLTLTEFLQEAARYYSSIKNGTVQEELKFLKFVLAGRRGLELDDQRSVTLNVLQGQPDIHHITATRDYDSLIGTTKTLPYTVPLTVWPIPSFRDTLKTNNHITAIAFNEQQQPMSVPMHKIPNVAFAKVANRSVIRVFFPHMYRLFNTNKIHGTDLELIYNRCLRPIVRDMMPNQSTHWPPSYQTAMETSRDRAGRLHLGSLDIPAHLLNEFGRRYLESLQDLRDYFRDAYFGHELRGWKAATVHNLDSDGEGRENDGIDGETAAYERVNALQDLTRVLDMENISQNQWLVDVGLEFGTPGQVVTWRSQGHETIVRYLLPDLQAPARTMERTRRYYIDNQMHLKDIAGFRWAPGTHSDQVHYIQAYTTEKAISYQLHHGIFSDRKPSELLTPRLCCKLVKDLNKQSKILYTCTGDDENQRENRPQEGCARLEVRVSLTRVDETMAEFPRHLYNETMVQIPARYWWYFKWIRLAAVYFIVRNHQRAQAKDRISENCLALGALAIWIINGAHHTPLSCYRTLGLAKQLCPQVLLEGEDDPHDPDARTQPLMYEAGVYFVCDIILDERTHIYRTPVSKSISADHLSRAFDLNSLTEVQHRLGVAEVQTGRPRPHLERTANRTTQQTLDVRQIRPAERALPDIGTRLDGLPLPDPPRARGPDVDYFQRHGGGNRRPGMDDDGGDDGGEEGVQDTLKKEVRVILEQMFFDILQESPNKKKHNEGPWTNIPRELRHEQAVEELYLQVELPFEAVQYAICSREQWGIHFNRFFPPEVPSHAGQNFGKCRYFHCYLNLVRRLPPIHLRWVRSELRKKFDSLAWVPHTESDRMWSTRKTGGGKWFYLPDGRMEGPQIAINPTAVSRLGHRPTLRLPPPRMEAVRGEGGEDGGEDGDGDSDDDSDEDDGV